MKIKLLVAVTGLLSLASLPVHAHTGLGTVHGLVDGLLHPLMGIDHLLVMLAIGLWAAKLGGRALWMVPGSFLLAMAAGAGLQYTGFTISAAETWVAFSVLASGWLVLKNQHISSGFAVAIAAGFALSHGYVHAAELQTGTEAMGYASGFLLTTAVLHGLGVAAGLSGAVRLKIINTALGLLCAIVGTTLLVGI